MTVELVLELEVPFERVSQVVLVGIRGNAGRSELGGRYRRLNLSQRVAGREALKESVSRDHSVGCGTGGIADHSNGSIVQRTGRKTVRRLAGQGTAQAVGVSVSEQPDAAAKYSLLHTERRIGKADAGFPYYTLWVVEQASPWLERGVVRRGRGNLSSSLRHSGKPQRRE